MKALTLYQPWASLIAFGDKRTETRSWSTKYRGLLAIHAAAHSPATAREFMLQVPFLKSACRHYYRFVPARGVFDALPVGAVVAIAFLADVVRIDEHCSVLESERSYGDYSTGRFAWRLTNVRQLPAPIAASGHQGLWDWDPPESVSAYLDNLMQTQENSGLIR